MTDPTIPAHPFHLTVDLVNYQLANGYLSVPEAEAWVRLYNSSGKHAQTARLLQAEHTTSSGVSLRIRRVVIE